VDELSISLGTLGKPQVSLGREFVLFSHDGFETSTGTLGVSDTIGPIVEEVV